MIGDITPKALQVVQESDAVIPGALLEEDRVAEDSDRMKVSSWNHAGAINHFILAALHYSSSIHPLSFPHIHRTELFQAMFTHTLSHSLTHSDKCNNLHFQGTWEEKDMTEFSKSRITSLCLLSEVRHSDSKASASGAKVRAYVTGNSDYR